MLIRPATEADLPAVLPMVGRTCAFHEALDAARYGAQPDPEQMYGNWLRRRVDDPRSVFLVAEREGRLVAFLVATTDKEMGLYRLREYGFIHDIWVEPDYRNEGIGRQMVMLSIERFGEIGVRQIRLDVLAGNEPARNLFDRCGFRVSTVQMLLET